MKKRNNHFTIMMWAIFVLFAPTLVLGLSSPTPPPPPAKAAASKAPAPAPAKGAPAVPAGATAKPSTAGGPAKASPAPVLAAVSAPAQAAADTYRYNPAGKSDPFKPFMSLEPVVQGTLKKPAKARTTPQSPLQRIELSQFTLVGIAGETNRRVAMVEDKAAKKFYPLIVGTYIGENDGRVAEILGDRIIVEEKVPAGKGKTKANRITLKLHQDVEEKP